MNKFRRFLGRILAETSLKMNYFGKLVNLQNRQKLGAPPLDSLASGS